MRPLNEVLQDAIDAHSGGNFGKAEQLYDRVIAQAPDNWAVLMNLGTLYVQVKRYGLAQVILEMAHKLNPKETGILGNLGAVYRTEGHVKKAMECYNKALEIDPKDAQILSNISGLHVNNGEPDKVLYWADRALAAAPNMPEPANHKALALLELGRYQEAFEKWYDSRLRLPHFYRRPYDCPQWDGWSLGHLAIHGEQGLGDEIMFLKCLGNAVNCKSVRIEVNPRLVRLLQNSYPKFKFFGTHDELIADARARGEEPEFHIALGSLPKFCWPPDTKPYLKPTTEYPKDWSPRIGLSWFGGTMTTHENLRNTLAEYWRQFQDLGHCISLQYGPREDEAEIIGIPHDADGIKDIDRLAAMIKSCDLVITVCNTTVHLAGALGVPALVLVPRKPAWRYGLRGEKMVWYESPVLCRQQPLEPWTSVLGRVKYVAEGMLAGQIIRDPVGMPELPTVELE